MGELSLVLRIGHERRAFTLAPGGPAIVIGRSPEVTLPLKAPLLSRRHCELKLVETGVELKDLGSANGTFVNGRRIQTAFLQPGDLLQLGDLDLRIEFDPGSAWVADAARAGDLRCQKCRRRISMSTVADGHSLEWGTEVVCPECREREGMDSGVFRRLGDLLASDGYTVLSQISKHSTISPVLKARRAGLDDLVAIKALPIVAGLSEKKVERFKAEARAMAQIKHPNVAHVYDVKQRPDVLYLVMELIEGETLLERIEARGKLQAAEALSIGVAIARALDAASSHGIVHRNVKPANILIARDGTPKLIDFGLAKGVKAFGPALTSEDETLGTIRYMPPEQVKDARSADHRSDVYSLAATLFHALTGKLPYPYHSELDLLKSVITGRLPAFSPTPTDNLPAGVSPLLARCLKHNPIERPQPAELCAELASILLTSFSSTALTPVDGAKGLTPPPVQMPSFRPPTSGLWRAVSAPGTMAGAFAKEELVELAQLLGTTCKTGVLEVRASGKEVGVLSFKDGKIVVARTTMGGRGESAAVEVLGVRSGDFEFRPHLPADVKPEHELAVPPLALEAVRRRDEGLL